MTITAFSLLIMYLTFLNLQVEKIYKDRISKKWKWVFYIILIFNIVIHTISFLDKKNVIELNPFYECIIIILIQYAFVPILLYICIFFYSFYVQKKIHDRIITILFTMVFTLYGVTLICAPFSDWFIDIRKNIMALLVVPLVIIVNALKGHIIDFFKTNYNVNCLIELISLELTFVILSASSVFYTMATVNIEWYKNPFLLIIAISLSVVVCFIELRFNSPKILTLIKKEK